MAFFGKKRPDPAIIAREPARTPPLLGSSSIRSVDREMASLREALTEALDGWAASTETDEDVARIAEIRKRWGA